MRYSVNRDEVCKILLNSIFIAVNRENWINGTECLLPRSSD